MLKVNNKDTRTTPIAYFTYFTLWTYFTPCSTVSVVNFEQVNADWAILHFYTHFYIIITLSGGIETEHRCEMGYAWKTPRERLLLTEIFPESVSVLFASLSPNPNLVK